MRSPLLIAFLLCARSLAFADDAPPEATVDAPAAPERPKTGSFSIGAGFSSDEGFLANAAVRQDDLFHTGQRLALTAELSSLRQEARVRHDVPDAFDSGLDVTTELWTGRRQLSGFVREGTGGAFTVGQRLDRATRAYVRYRVERAATVPLDPMALARGGSPLADGHVIATVGAGVEYDTLDARVLPRSGTRLALDAETGDRRIGSDVGLVRVSAALDHARPLGPFTLRVQGRAGYVRGRDGDAVPLSERYQHDGNADLPGYGLGSFGVGMDGVGGGYDGEAIGRAELELPVIPRAGLSIAAFAGAAVDYNADPTWGPTGASAHRSVGVSVIWRSPIGPLRFDWAMPLDHGDNRPHFSFGFGTTW